MENEYILLNNQPFVFTSRTFSEEDIGGELERSITGKAHRDFVTTKCKWSFLFDSISGSDCIRFRRIFGTHKPITLIDYDGTSYTVFWISAFAPAMLAKDCFSLPIDFEEE
jgi:hypothetical protein